MVGVSSLMNVMLVGIILLFTSSGLGYLLYKEIKRGFFNQRLRVVYYLIGFGVNTALMLLAFSLCIALYISGTYELNGWYVGITIT